MKGAVRRLAEGAGCALEPMPFHDAVPQCCSFGGQPGVANPEYADFVVKKRISESENPYITYCINCRDVFLNAGKEAVHILDLLLGRGKGPEKLATVSQRRENRIQLKGCLLKNYWNVTAEEKKAEKRKINISETLEEKFNKARILTEDIIDVLDFCERTGRRVFHADTGTFSGYHVIGHTTYWVEYRILDSELSYELVNAYAHRIKIELEAVWNGKKVIQEQ